MPITLLLDLDDTLLETNTEEFLRAYYAGLAQYLGRLVGSTAMLAALHSGVRLMQFNQDPSRTLQSVFDNHFYSQLEADREELCRAIQRFYDEEFPKLRSSTRTMPGARELIALAVSTGHTLAIATNPLFPRAANLERIRWAGLDPQQFDLISSFETFHFTKSHPVYFAEMLGRLGWPDRPALMVGNDVERDLQPAQELGLETFHITRGRKAAGTRSGDLLQLLEWLAAHDTEIQPPAIKSREAILAVLQATPAVLQGMTAHLSAEEWTREPSPDSWAMIELVCHLRDTEREVHARQITALLASETPFVARPDAAVWAKQRRYLSEDGHTALQELAAARVVTLDRLRAMPDALWSRSARHAIFGPTHFLEVIGFMAEHDRLHVQQAWRTLHGETRTAHRI